ncbi:MAG: hypothetical protein ABJF11_13800 [Reichenbachiella sp.]|uniref:hypothetical protein n=1 Tax=Reichenbachiella sp. TaxID=2184521 RepID=UPI0032671B98
MKRIFTIVLIAGCINPLFSQIEMGKTKNTIMGKNKLLLVETNEMVLDNFSINLILYGFGEDIGGGGAQVGIRADLSEIDETLAQEIVNEAYAYFKAQWKKRGVEVASPSIAQIVASKKYSKAEKKGKATIRTGGIEDNHTKKNHNMMAWPEGENIPYSGSGPLALAGNCAHGLCYDAKFSGFNTGFSSTINFITFKSAALGSTASVRTFPQLTAANTLTATTWQKGKVGGYIGSNNAKGIEDFFTDVEQKEIDVLNASANMWNYIGDKAKYKANVLEMIKKGMDDMFADLEAVKEKSK